MPVWCQGNGLDCHKGFFPGTNCTVRDSVLQARSRLNAHGQFLRSVFTDHSYSQHLGNFAKATKASVLAESVLERGVLCITLLSQRINHEVAMPSSLHVL